MSDCKHKATIKNVETGREYCQDCHKVIINKEFIKKFGPCSDGWKNYLTLHEKFEGTLLEFLHLDGVPSSDKLWLFTQSIPEIERQQRIFAVLCMDRCQTEVSEINDLQLLVMLHWESIDYIGDIEHMKDEE
ncbi:MAG: hypothetical protein KAR20_08670, partial [Candidatus Heimdallarchaeota archaeon]|nr:hypothetical protein [Candidatus Heimdallarchaeota archaeon]